MTKTYNMHDPNPNKNAYKKVILYINKPAHGEKMAMEFYLF